MKTVNVAVVGLGSIARTHITALRALPAVRQLQAEPVLHTLVTRRAGEVAGEARAMGFANVWDDLDVALQDPEIDLIDICTPNALHRAQVEAAAAAGKAIYCEKPLGANLADAEAMTGAVARAGVVEQVALVYRYHPAVARIKAMLAAGAIGELVQFRAAYNHSGYLDPAVKKAAWKSDAAMAGGGALIDLGVHTIDMVQFLVGPLTLKHAEARTFVKRRAVQGGETDVSVDDWGLIHVEGPAGVPGWIETSRVALGAEGHRVELFGTQGSIVVDLDHDLEPRLTRFDGSGAPAGAAAHAALQYLPPARLTLGKFVDCHQAGLYHLLLRMAGADPTPGWAPDFAACLAAERLVYKALEAARQV